MRNIPLPIFDYIRHTWRVMTRSHKTLLTAASDPKFKPAADGRWSVYVAKDTSLEAVEKHLRDEMPPADFEKIRLRPLPSDPMHIHEHGLLYLPRQYVVPGGRFNEMYGWDSFFIQMGLLRDGEFELAKDLADNFLYEVLEYGKVLNANRTYYLTRSQPPFLTQMILAIYRHSRDEQWLKDAIPALEEYHRFWTIPPHCVEKVALSRYFDLGEGPAPEAAFSERDERGHTSYDAMRRHFRDRHNAGFHAGSHYHSANDALTPHFYKGDRSMRESGFDPSDRFGPFSADITHYAPVCLNSLLYQMEIDLAEIHGLLDHAAKRNCWLRLAGERAETINALMWCPNDGLYYDWNFADARMRPYPFLTTFYPLWTGIASRAQAAQVAGNLKKFECPGGLQTSTVSSGCQWDSPLGWAPLQWIAIEGLRRYGFHREANRISRKFLKMVTREFSKYGTIVEKYDVARCSADVSSHLKYGYHSNEPGFGWTNGVFTALYDALHGDDQKQLMTPLAPSADPLMI